MYSMTFRSALLKTRRQWPVTCLQCYLAKRSLFHPSVLGITYYLKERELLEQRLGLNKDKFLPRLKDCVKKKSPLFTDDMRTLLVLARDKEMIDFSLEAWKEYCEQQKKSAFRSHLNLSDLMLKMFYVNKEIQGAFEWFYNDERAMVRQLCRNLPCFVLMLDMLYKDGRYDDIVILASTFDEYFPNSNWKLSTLYLGALYHIGTNDALFQLQSHLNNLVIRESLLPSRCLLFSAMLAYKQKEFQTMLEILELPIFLSVSNRYSGKGVNIKLLADIELGRLDEGVMSLKALLVNMPKAYPIIFSNILQRTEDKLSSTDDIHLKASFNEIRLALIRGGFVTDYDLETAVTRLVAFREVQAAEKLQTSRDSYRGFADNKMYQPHR